MNITSADDNPLKDIKMASVGRNAGKCHSLHLGRSSSEGKLALSILLRSVFFEHSAPYGTGASSLNILVQRTVPFLFTQQS